MYVVAVAEVARFDRAALEPRNQVELAVRWVSRLQ